MRVKTTNNAFGTLASDINNSVTTITLSGGQGAKFPSLSTDEYFFGTLIAVDNTTEIVKVIARNTDVLTVTRAQDNTSASAFSTGDRFELRPTAALFNEFVRKTGDEITGDIKFPPARAIQMGVTNSIPDGVFKIESHGNGNSSLHQNANDLGISVSGTDTNFIVYGDDGTTSVVPVKYIENSGSTGEVRLFHYGVTKLATKATGVNVTGQITLNNSSTVATTGKAIAMAMVFG